MTALTIIGAALAAAIAAALAFVLGRSSKADLVPESEEERRRVLAAADSEADAIKRQAGIEAKEATQRLRSEVEHELRVRRQELDREMAELHARAEAADRRERELKTEREGLLRKEKQLLAREQTAEAVARAAAGQGALARARLEKIAGMGEMEARKLLTAEVQDEARAAAAAEVKRIEEEAVAEAKQRAQLVLGAAVQRYASEYVAERTVAVVALPSDDMKGRIIGREGRNIRALESATGIDLIIDDTPEAVVISCFNPVRREIARLALTRLIADGRIHPTRIEEMVRKATDEVEAQCKEAGDQASFDLGVGRLHPDLARLLGKLRFRSGTAQNLLQHAIEVGFLAGTIAGELGYPVKLARRAGLLHDIGCGVDQEIEGSHAAAGAIVARKFGEAPKICHAIEAHHGEVVAEDVLDHIVDAANVLANQRPGARRETLTSYVQRLDDLEKLASSCAGVERAFAIQAGREVRVLVENATVSDEQARSLSKEIARKVEAQLSYPGQIRVSVVRETRVVDFAK
ncbi:MAG: ribonuclease Y [Polyangia bacterium]|jgi:ribonuclease Y